MPDQPRPADLATLHARLAAQEGQILAQQARLARLERRRLPRRALPVLLAALLVALIPLATLAANPFTDLNPGSAHNPNIDAIYTAGITTGCVPNARYCPNDLVTREQMASFLARTAGVGGNPPVANAKTAQTAGYAATAGSAQSATSATTATNAQNAQNAVNAQSAQSATSAGHATTAGSAQSAQTAGHATTADNATNATNAQHATNAGNASTVGGYAPGQLTRVAWGAGSISLGGDIRDIATATITAPVAGYVAVSASARAYTQATSGCPCTITLYLLDLNTGTYSHYAMADTLDNRVTGDVAFTGLANHWVFPVAAGHHEFAARAQVSGSPNNGVYADATVTLLFSPFAATGAGSLATGPDQPPPAP